MARKVGDILDALGGCSEEQPVALGGYDVVRRLGAGGMGSVYEAIDRKRGARVALKTLLDADPAASMRLKREFRIAADLAHPNLAPLHELVEVDGLHFFTMALVQGERFSVWARQERHARALADTMPLSRAFDAPPTVPTLHALPSGISPAAEADEVSPPERPYDEIRRGFLELARGLIAPARRRPLPWRRQAVEHPHRRRRQGRPRGLRALGLGRRRSSGVGHQRRGRPPT